MHNNADTHLFQVVLLDLEVLSDISASSAGVPINKSSAPGDSPETPPTPHQRLMNTYFTKFMINLLRMFSTDRKLLEDRGSFIIRYVQVYR